MNLSFLPFIIMLVLVLLGFPIAHSMLLSVVATTFLMGEQRIFLTIAHRLILGIDSFPLMAIPFFILSGTLMEVSGISERLVKWIEILMHRIPAKYACITVGASTFFGAVTGSANATTAAIGGVIAPEMRKAGYEDKHIGTITGCSGILGALIPPSVPMMTYAVQAGVSITTMFMAGIMPGIILAILFIILSIIMFGKVEPGDKKKYPAKQYLISTWQALPAIFMPVIILGGIYGGVFTCTEAAAISVIYALVVAVVLYRTMSAKELFRALLKSARFTATIMLLVAYANAFSWFLAHTGLAQGIATSLLNFFNSKFAILLAMNILMLIEGCFMDTLSIILLMTPVFLPVITALGLSPVYLGVIMILNTLLGLITPPMGGNLMVGAQVAGMRSMGPSIPSAMIFVAVGCVLLFLLTYIPSLTLILPKALGCIL